MAEDINPFPSWSEPATKGDVVRAMVYSRAVTVQVISAIVALKNGDQGGVDVAIREYFAKSKELADLIADIGGRPQDG